METGLAQLVEQLSTSTCMTCRGFESRIRYLVVWFMFQFMFMGRASSSLALSLKINKICVQNAMDLAVRCAAKNLKQ